MGVYIKGMEMPKTGCVIAICANGDVIDTQDKVLGRAVSVPPHGDLIDAQEEMRLMQSCDYDTYDDYSRAFDMLDNAPIIIPAEEGE